ncbi:hypothetical protein HK102_000131 [Quaeritorhiza haematococci]|nr:hypothetical protein HK102_000131 [Quaeritorhiza haematococci]
MSFTSDELNYLVYRYLLESGFTHSTFAFQQECAIHNFNIKGSTVKPGALINLIQKGLQYLEVETHVNEDGTEKKCCAPFTLLGAHHCEAPPPDEDEETNEAGGGAGGEKSSGGSGSGSKSKKNQRKEDSGATVGSKRERKEERRQKGEKEREKRQRKESTSEAMTKEHKTNGTHPEQKETVSTPSAEKASTTQPPATPVDEPMPDAEGEPVKAVTTSSTTDPSIQVPPEDIIVLEGHESEVFVVAWNTNGSPLLASGSGDGTARIWQVPDKPTDPVATPVVLLHNTTSSESKDVTTLDWNPTGTLLATGSYDGQARIWTKTGELKFAMRKHLGPIFSLRWNKKGDLLLSGSVDRTAIIWDTHTGEARQQFQFHAAPTLDLDWRDDITFATCSTDRQIYVCQLGSPEPLKHFSGHEDEVNCLKWDPSGKYIASCSDDHSTKVWSMDSDKCVWDLQGHEKEIYNIKWSPVSIGSEKHLASASFDSTVRVWDATKGTCVYTLEKHTEAVYSVSFSPNGLYLASGSFDQSLHIWSMKDGSLVKSYTGMGGIFEVSWSPGGDRLAACFADSTVIVMNLQKLLT